MDFKIRLVEKADNFSFDLDISGGDPFLDRVIQLKGKKKRKIKKKCCKKYKKSKHCKSCPLTC